MQHGRNNEIIIHSRVKRWWNSGSGNFLMKSRRENWPPLGKLNKFLNRRNENFWDLASLFLWRKIEIGEVSSWKLNLRAIADVPARWEEERTVDFREVSLITIFENFLIRLNLFGNFIKSEIHNFYLKCTSNILEHDVNTVHYNRWHE